jgi:DNA-binding response OmpR family regulator/nitrogen-specific signal transduction histidine kinase
MDQARILVVDDEETILFVISKVLESHGYQVFAVSSAEKARELLDVTTVDAALLDLVLPGQSGLELLRIIKREHGDTEVIMMTSHASIDTAVQAMREGAYDYLHKPFEDIDDVWACVSRALDRGRLARLNRELVAKQEQANRELSVLVQRLKSLVHAGQVMGKLRNEAELFDFVLQQVRLELGAERISVMLVNQETGQLRIVASLGLEHVQVSEVRVPMGSGIAGRVAASGEPVLANAGDDPADSFMSAPIVMSAPLVGWHRTLGVINVTARPSGHPFEQQDLQFLEGLSGQVATSIERVRHLDELQKAYDSLKSAQDHAVAVEKLRALGQMAAGVAHDFNNTLAVILARSEAAIWEADGQSPDPAGIRSQLEHVLKAAREGAATVRRIQEYSGIRRDQPAGSVDLNAAVQDVIELARPRWQSDPGTRGIRIEVVTDFADIPAVRSNPADLSAVLSNLIFNSVEAMPQGGRITFATRQEGERVRLDVTDTGVGMSEEVRRRIFEPFYTTKKTGQGLGMSIVQGILARHGAEIDVASQEGKGTMTTILLPASSEAVGPAPQPAEKKSKRSKAVDLSVLLVDDDERVRSVIHDMLAMGGMDVVSVESGEAALAALDKRTFDAVVTDLSMPGMGGIELSTRIKERHSDLPVVLMSGRATEQVEEEIREAKIKQVLQKPFEMAALIDVIAGHKKRRGKN